MDDLRVLSGVGRGGGTGLEADERAGAAHAVEQACAAELFGHGHRVGRLSDAVERCDGFEDMLMRGLVEVVRLDHFDGIGNGVLAQHHGAEQRLLGTDVVRRDPR